MQVKHTITAHHLQAAAVELAETRYCGVSSMPGKATKPSHTYSIIAAGT